MYCYKKGHGRYIEFRIDEQMMNDGNLEEHELKSEEDFRKHNLFSHNEFTEIYNSLKSKHVFVDLYLTKKDTVIAIWQQSDGICPCRYILSTSELKGEENKNIICYTLLDKNS